MKRLHQRRGLSAYAARSGWGCPSRLERNKHRARGDESWQQHEEIQDVEAEVSAGELAGATAAVAGLRSTTS